MKWIEKIVGLGINSSQKTLQILGTGSSNE